MPLYPRLIFHPSHDDRSKSEMTQRGYVSHVYVETEADVFYPVFFYDPVRLGQDLATESEQGRPFIAELGTIVVPEVTIEAMFRAVVALHRDGYFSHLFPIVPDLGAN